MTKTQSACLSAFTFLILLVSPLLGQSSSPEASISISAGVAGIDQFESERLTFDVAVEVPILNLSKGDLLIGGKGIWIEGGHEFPRGLDVCKRCPVCCVACIKCDPADEIQGGDIFILAPTLGYQPRLDRLRIAFYGGVGAYRESGRASATAAGRFKTETSTSPAALYGVTLGQPLSDRTMLRFEVGGFTVFTGSTEIEGPGGEPVPVDHRTVTSGRVTVGVGIRL